MIKFGIRNLLKIKLFNEKSKKLICETDYSLSEEEPSKVKEFLNGVDISSDLLKGSKIDKLDYLHSKTKSSRIKNKLLKRIELESEKL